MTGLRSRMRRIERRHADLRSAGLYRRPIDLRRLSGEELWRLKSLRARAIAHGNDGQPAWSVLTSTELAEIRRLFDLTRTA
jgi:hypothetical protein